MLLYQIAGCPFAWRTRIVLDEKRLPFETEFFDREHRPPELGAIGPDAKSPTLVDGEAAIWESIVINEYLEDRYPERPLLPADPLERARVRTAVHEVDKKLMPGFGALVLEVLLKPPDQRDPAAAGKARAEVREALAFFDRKLEGRQFLAGRQFSLADVMLFTPIPTMRSVAGEEVPAPLAHLRAWFERIAARPSTRPVEAPAR